MTNYDVIESYAEDFTAWKTYNRADVDITPNILTDNLIVAATKEYPDLFGGVTIGNGKIKIGIPGIDKDIVLEAADIDHFKSCLK